MDESSYQCWVCSGPATDPRWFVRFWRKVIPLCPECRQQAAQLFSNIGQLRSFLRLHGTHIGIPKWKV